MCFTLGEKKLGNNKDQKAVVHRGSYSAQCLSASVQECLTQTSLDRGCHVSTPSKFWDSLKQVPLAQKQCIQFGLGLVLNCTLLG